MTLKISEASLDRKLDTNDRHILRVSLTSEVQQGPKSWQEECVNIEISWHDGHIEIDVENGDRGRYPVTYTHN